MPDENTNIPAQQGFWATRRQMLTTAGSALIGGIAGAWIAWRAMFNQLQLFSAGPPCAPCPPKVDELPLQPLGHRNMLVIQAKTCTETASPNYGKLTYKILSAVRLCTRNARVAFIQLSHDSNVNQITVKQAVHFDSTWRPEEKHDFNDLFAQHPGGSAGTDFEHSFTLHKNVPEKFMLKDPVYDHPTTPNNNDYKLSKRSNNCNFNNHDRPSARCVNFSYFDQTGTELGVCEGSPDDTDFHFEC